MASLPTRRDSLVLIGERRLEPQNADELTERGKEALKRRHFTEAVDYFEKALRIRISNEDKSALESIRRMLKYADAWFLKGREICKSSNSAELASSSSAAAAPAVDSITDLRAKLKNMTRTMSGKILQNLPDGSVEKMHMLSLLAEANWLVICVQLSTWSATLRQQEDDQTAGPSNPTYN